MNVIRDTLDALRYGTVVASRGGLAIAAALYALTCFFGPGKAQVPSDAAFVLVSDWKVGWGIAFALDAIALFWRLFSPRPRPRLAVVVNLYTFALWVGITGGTVMAANYIDPDIVGYVMFCLVAFHALIRTDLTQHDRETA